MAITKKTPAAKKTPVKLEAVMEQVKQLSLDLHHIDDALTRHILQSAGSNTPVKKLLAEETATAGKLTYVQWAKLHDDMVTEFRKAHPLLFTGTTDKPKPKLLRDVPFGKPVTLKATGRHVVKVRPVGQLLNSRIISDIVSRGDFLIVDAGDGATLHIARGDSEVTERG